MVAGGGAVGWGVLASGIWGWLLAAKWVEANGCSGVGCWGFVKHSNCGVNLVFEVVVCLRLITHAGAQHDSIRPWSLREVRIPCMQGATAAALQQAKQLSL
jgi:hypothetical protein